MPRPIDLIGSPPFGRLTVVGIAEPVLVNGGRWKLRRWLCRCSCGNTVAVKTANLTCGLTRSCGCLQREKASSSGRRLVGVRIAKTCVRCKAPFEGTHKQKFCTRACKDAPLPRDGLACVVCRESLPYRRTGQRRNYCSYRCKMRAANLREAALATANLEGMACREN